MQSKIIIILTKGAGDRTKEALEMRSILCFENNKGVKKIRELEATFFLLQFFSIEE